MKLINFVICGFKDDREISVAEVEDGSFLLVVQNPNSPTRAKESSIWLSKESFLGLITTCHMYWSCKGVGVGDLAMEAMNGDGVSYNFSDNLKPFNKDLV